MNSSLTLKNCKICEGITLRKVIPSGNLENLRENGSNRRFWPNLRRNTATNSDFRTVSRRIPNTRNDPIMTLWHVNMMETNL